MDNKIIKFLIRIISAIPGLFLLHYFLGDKINYTLVLKWGIGITVVIVVAWLIYVIKNYKYGK